MADVDAKAVGRAVEDAVREAAKPSVESKVRVSAHAGDQEAASELRVVQLVAVKVTRGTETINTDVMEHEIRILELVHGEDSVQVDEEAEAGEAEIDASAEAEWERLKRKYNNGPDDFVSMAYPEGKRGLRGFKVGAGKKAPQADVTVRMPAKKGVQPS